MNIIQGFRKVFPVGLLMILAIFTFTACQADINTNQPPLTAPATSSYPPPFTTTDLHIPGWNRLLAYDAIRPVYDPQFISAEQAQEQLQETELVMGVAWEGMAKAYPVTVLIQREMVNDEMAGIPYLVSW